MPRLLRSLAALKSSAAFRFVALATNGASMSVLAGLGSTSAEVPAFTDFIRVGGVVLGAFGGRAVLHAARRRASSDDHVVCDKVSELIIRGERHVIGLRDT